MATDQITSKSSKSTTAQIKRVITASLRTSTRSGSTTCHRMRIESLPPRSIESCLLNLLLQAGFRLQNARTISIKPVLIGFKSSTYGNTSKSSHLLQKIFPSFLPSTAPSFSNKQNLMSHKLPTLYYFYVPSVNIFTFYFLSSIRDGSSEYRLSLCTQLW